MAYKLLSCKYLKFIFINSLFLIINRPLTIFTIAFYLLSAYTNPGYIIGNEAVQLAKAQDYNMKHNPSISAAGGASIGSVPN